MLSLAASLAFAPVLALRVDPKASLGPRTAPTLHEAMVLARRVRLPGQAVEIVLAPGDHTVESPVVLGNADGNLRISGQGKARLLGGRRVLRWSVSDDPRIDPAARGKVYVSDLPASMPGVDLGQLKRRGFGLPRQTAGLELFFDDQPMPVAAYPNPGDPEGGWLRIGKVAGPKEFESPDVPALKWGAKDLWVLGYWTFDWAESYERVLSVDPGTRMVATEEPGGSYGFAVGRRFRFLNAVQAIDQPGEWCLDRDAAKLFFWPPKSLAEGKPVASVLAESMFKVSDAEDVVLSGLVLEAGRDGGVETVRSRRVVVENCTIRNFGTYGASFRECADSGLRSCDLSGLGESGVILDGGDRQTLKPGGLFVDDCDLGFYSRWCRTYSPAVNVSGVGHRVTRNYIHDAPHNGILLGGNDHLIEGNDFQRLCTETGDAGAVYMGRNPTMRGTVIRNNRFREMGHTVKTEGNFTEVMSVYLDDCWCGTTIEGNVFEGTGTGLMIGGGRDNIVRGNLFLGNRPAISLDSRGTGWASKMFLAETEWGFPNLWKEVPAEGPVYTAKYPPLARYWADEPAKAKGNVIVDNVCAGPDWIRYQDGLTTADHVDRGNVHVKESRTVSEAVQMASPTFRPIPLDRIGLRRRR